MSNSGKLGHLSVGVFECARACVSRALFLLFCLCFVSRSLEWDCLRQRRYSSHDGLSLKISGVSRLVRARMYTRLFAGEGLRVTLCLRLHACLILLSLIVTVVPRRPSLKLISHSGGFFVCGQPLLIRILPLGLLWYWNPPMVWESSIGEYQQCSDCHSISQSSLTRFWLSGPEWRLLILSYATHIQFFPKCHSNVSHHISHWIYCMSRDTFFLCCFCKSALTLI